LTKGDWKLFRAFAVRTVYERDDVIVREGSESRGIMVLESGWVRVEQSRDGLTTTLAYDRRIPVRGPAVSFFQFSSVSRDPHVAGGCEARWIRRNRAMTALP